MTKWLLDHKYGLNWSTKPQAKTTPKIARSALSGDPTAVRLVTNHSFLLDDPA